MSTLDFRNLPQDRLGTTDEEGNRRWIIPARVRGKWKTRKTLLHIPLLLIFILTPWLRWKGDPLVLFDLGERRFILFGEIFSAHDGPLVFFVLGLLGFGLIMATALWGRVWCGWACPQTVFIEQVFRRIESLVVGNRATQIAASKNPFAPKNFLKLFTKWSLFIITSIFLAHTFIAYFVSWESLFTMMFDAPSANWTVFLFTFAISAFILFDFAWFREQFCIIMCPYGRFQSVLMDQNSVTITYDHKRGEPRVRKVSEHKEGDGDCIDCFKCVSVCPTGIDIRRGQQMECVGCTACIDACDEVMTKIKRPKGLIRYAALADIEKQGRKVLRPRLFFYGFIMLLLGISLAVSLSRHETFYFSLLRQNKRPYSIVEVESGKLLINNYRFHLKNPLGKNVDYRILLKGDDLVTMAPPQIEGTLEPKGNIYRPFFVQVSFAHWKKVQVYLELQYKKGDQWQSIEKPIQFAGP